MRLISSIVVAIVLHSTSLQLASQVAPSAKIGGSHIVVGTGYSNFYSDWNGRIDGITVWADWKPNHLPSIMRGMGIEFEGRDLNYNRTGRVPNLRQDTAVAGLIYSFHPFFHAHPYAKALAGVGSIDFQHIRPTYSHDTRAIYATGGGLEFRLMHSVWIRGDYEYQFWPDFFHYHTLSPNGVTIGATYQLGGFRRRR